MERDRTSVTSMRARASLVRRFYRVGGFAFVTAAMLPGYLTHRRLTPASRQRALHDRWIRAWSRALLRLFGAHLHVDGKVPVSSRGRLVVSNHRSTLDIAALLATFGGSLVSRDDLRKWPIVGAAARSARTIFVDRSDTMSGASAIRAMRDRLRAADTISVFPEGTTFPDDTVRPFHAGAFVAALNTNASIVPVGIALNHGSEAAFVHETFGAHLTRMSGAASTRIVLAIGEPLDVLPGARVAAMRDDTHAAVQTLVYRARQISLQLDATNPLGRTR